MAKRVELSEEQKAELRTWPERRHLPPFPFETRLMTQAEWDFIEEERKAKLEAEHQARMAENAARVAGNR